MITHALRIVLQNARRKLETELLANSNDGDELQASTVCLPRLAFCWKPDGLPIERAHLGGGFPYIFDVAMGDSADESAHLRAGAVRLAGWLAKEPQAKTRLSCAGDLFK